MSFKSYIAKSMAVLFLLMLGLKFGGGLFLHCVLHISENAETKSNEPGNNTLSYACNCIDDFSSPFDDAGSFTLSAAPLYSEKPVSFCEQFYVTPTFLFHSLRAPPVSVT
jgi:hypothetical protein